MFKSNEVFWFSSLLVSHGQVKAEVMVSGEAFHLPMPRATQRKDPEFRVGFSLFC